VSEQGSARGILSIKSVLRDFIFPPMPIITSTYPPLPERPLFIEAQIILTHARINQRPSELAEAIINQVVDSVSDYGSRIRPNLQRILQTIPGFGQSSRNTILESVTGYLSCQGIFQGQSHFWQGGIRNLNQITAQEINDLTFRAQESNDLQWYELLWKFHIVTISIQRGGDPKVKPPRWAPQVKFRETWSGHEGVNCAAFALVYMMYCTERRYDRYITKSLRDAKSLMDEIGWGVTCSLADLKKFTDKYPKYRLTIILPFSANAPFSFQGADFNGEVKYMLYLVYDPKQQHFAATKSPQEIYRKTKGEHVKWCHKCVIRYPITSVHTCPDGCESRKKIQVYKCLKCGELGKHTCPLISCKSCAEFFKRGDVHRCIVFMEKKSEEKNKFFQDGDEEDGKYPALWVYDLESRIEIKETSQRLIAEFLFEDNGKYYYKQRQDEPVSSVCVYNHTIQEHRANLVVLKNVFKPQENYRWFGDTAVQDFILFITQFNKGNNICLAHNGSGYDTRILFSECKDMNQKVDMFPIMRGGKFMQLILNKSTVFRDSMLHVRGSIKSLAKDFCDGLLEKGYFPHLFNSVENYGYVGPIPDKKYFDLSFSCRSEKDFDDFNAWHDSWEGEWNFMQQLVLYCENDVDVLATIVKKYHDISENSFGISPWHNATAPSYVHEVFLRKLGAGLNLPTFKSNPEEYKNRINDLALNHFWAVLKPCEYWFARAALRGGRTDVRKLYHQISEQDWNRGVRIRYQDICSQYPYQQVVHDFPVGVPRIHVYNHRYHPCITHQKSQEIVCNCESKGYMRECKISSNETPPTAQEIIEKNLFGIFCATVEPPKNIYHPVLIAYDEKLGKSVASCETLVEQFFTSVEFIKALQNGYKIIQLFRFDEYTRKPSLWSDIVQDLFIEKMVNSKSEPSGEQKILMVNQYREKFGDVFAEKIQNSFTPERWGKRPAQKQTAKIGMNSGWGKHAQRPIMEETLILPTSGKDGEIDSFFSNCIQNNFTYKDGMYLGSSMVMYKYIKDGPTTEPNLHKGYLPAALFVPAYGRLQLWEEMNKLGKRVLMNDTDSIIYVYDPNQYNIPQGSLLGEWEVEDIDTDNGGIREFVGLGPKTYALKCDNGKELVKAKGLSLNLATSQLVNFESMKGLAKTFLENYQRDIFKSGVIKVPQKTFVWSVKDGMRTWLMLKDLKFNYDDVKGVMDGEGYLYPFGFSQ
jgi:hypothetical protein